MPPGLQVRQARIIHVKTLCQLPLAQSPCLSIDREAAAEFIALLLGHGFSSDCSPAIKFLARSLAQA